MLAEVVAAPSAEGGSWQTLGDGQAVWKAEKQLTSGDRVALEPGASR